MRSATTKKRQIRPSERLAKGRAEVLATLARYGATNVRVFGSVARGDDEFDSDIDLLADLPSGTGLFKRGRLTQDLEDILGCRVDLVQACEVHERSRARVFAEARSL